MEVPKAKATRGGQEQVLPLSAGKPASIVKLGSYLFYLYRILLELNHLIHGLGDLAVSGVEMVPLNLQSLSLKLLTTFLFSVCFFQPRSFIF